MSASPASSGWRPADGLAEQVRAASCDHGIKRWRLYLTQEQMGSVAYGLWLHRMTGSAAEANRFARSTASSTARPGPRTARRRAEGPRGAVRESAGEGDGDGRGLLQAVAAPAALLGQSRWAPAPAWVRPVPSGSHHAARPTASREVSRCR
ncbi:DUF6417 family protein [Streptomyces sp. NPDC056704]|uniref:DUF6417 family protein n=1 Tax=Streptomyces sp. NPDC056704 TaxID=3345917 RepID=UPI0036A7C5E2